MAEGVTRWIEANGGLLLSLVGIFFLLVIAYWVVSTIASAGVMSGVSALDQERPSGFGRAWAEGATAFWRLFRMGLLLVLIALAVGAAFAVSSPCRSSLRMTRMVCA
jgi:hypothetical protein